MINAFTDLALLQFVEIHQQINPPAGIGKDELFKLMQDAIKNQSPVNSGSNTPVYNLAASSPCASLDGDVVNSSTWTRMTGSVSAKGWNKLKSGLILKKGDDQFKVEIPCCGCIDYTGGGEYRVCQGIKFVHGMAVPCPTRPSKDEATCKGCAKNDMKFGKATDLISSNDAQWKAPSGKQGISFGTYCMKRDWGRAEIEELIKEFNQENCENLVIPEHQWFLDLTKGKRSVKNVSVSSDSGSVDGSEEAPKKRRGRPPKDPNAPPKDPNAPKKKRGRPKKNEVSQVKATAIENAEEDDDAWMKAALAGDDEEENKSETPVVNASNNDENNSDIELEEEEEVEIDEDDDGGFTILDEKIDGKWYGYDSDNVAFWINGPDDWEPTDDLQSEYLEIAGAWNPEEEKIDFKSED